MSPGKDRQRLMADLLHAEEAGYTHIHAMPYIHMVVAATGPRTDLLEVLVEQGQDPMEETLFGRTTLGTWLEKSLDVRQLDRAAEKDVLAFLLSHGADPTVPCRALGPLHADFGAAADFTQTETGVRAFCDIFLELELSNTLPQAAPPKVARL
jgi:hypothetical protein